MGKKEQRELIITGVAAAVLIFLLISTFSKMTAKRAAPPAEGGLSSSAALPPNVAEPLLPPHRAGGESEKKDQEWGRDPFILGKITAQEGIGFALNGVIWDATEPYAIINDEVVRKGDRIGGYKVIDITEEKVILDNGVEQITLNVWE